MNGIANENITNPPRIAIEMRMPESGFRRNLVEGNEDAKELVWGVRNVLEKKTKEKNGALSLNRVARGGRLCKMKRVDV